MNTVKKHIQGITSLLVVLILVLVVPLLVYGAIRLNLDTRNHAASTTPPSPTPPSIVCSQNSDCPAGSVCATWPCPPLCATEKELSYTCNACATQKFCQVVPTPTPLISCTGNPTVCAPGYACVALSCPKGCPKQDAKKNPVWTGECAVCLNKYCKYFGAPVPTPVAPTPTPTPVGRPISVACLSNRDCPKGYVCPIDCSNCATQKELTSTCNACLTQRFYCTLATPLPTIVPHTPKPTASPLSYTCPVGGYVNCSLPLTPQKIQNCSVLAIAWYKTHCPSYRGIIQ